MEIKDLSWNESINKSPLLPRSIRGVIVGKSGCGKTTLLLNLLLRPRWLDYNKTLRVWQKSFSTRISNTEEGIRRKTAKGSGDYFV